MKSKKTAIAVVILGTAVIALGSVYFKNQNQPSSENTQEQGNGEPEDQGAQTEITTDDFSIDLPADWQQVQPDPGVAAMAINMEEEISDPAAQKLAFRTYFAISNDALNGKTMDEYIEALKQALSENIPGIVYAKEENLTINSRPARAMEMELTQEDINFKVLMVVLKDDEGNAWAVSFNTTVANWSAYRDLFYNTADSFSLD